MQNNLNISTIVKKRTHVKDSILNEIKKYLVVSAVTLAIVLSGQAFVSAQEVTLGYSKLAQLNNAGGANQPTINKAGGVNQPVKNTVGGSGVSSPVKNETPEKLDDPLGESVSIEGLLLKLFEIILYVGVPIVAMFLIWSGFMFVSAQGNPEKIETAKSRLLYTIIGAILLLGAWTISQAIKGTVEDIKRGGTVLHSTVNNLS